MNAARAVRARAPAPRSSASGVTPCAIPSSSSYSGATKLASPPLRTSPSITLACELRWSTHRCAGRRQRQAQRVVALGGAVGQKPASARRRRRRRRAARPARTASATGPTSMPSMSWRDVEQQRPLAERACAARDRRRRRPCGRARGSGSSRGSRRRSTASRYGAVGCAEGGCPGAGLADAVTLRSSRSRSVIRAAFSR